MVFPLPIFEKLPKLQKNSPKKTHSLVKMGYSMFTDSQQNHFLRKIATFSSKNAPFWIEKAFFSTKNAISTQNATFSTQSATFLSKNAAFWIEKVIFSTQNATFSNKNAFFSFS